MFPIASNRPHGPCDQAKLLASTFNKEIWWAVHKFHGGQGGLACCDSWGRKESDRTERLNWTELRPTDSCETFLLSKYIYYMGSLLQRADSKMWPFWVTFVTRCSNIFNPLINPSFFSTWYWREGDVSILGISYILCQNGTRSHQHSWIFSMGKWKSCLLRILSII